MLLALQADEERQKEDEDNLDRLRW